jgi:uncharacterized membrane protein YqjE
MDSAPNSFEPLTATSKSFARRLLTIGGNRLELLAVEVQEGRERLLHTVLMVFGVAAFGLLASVTLTAALVILFWAWSPVAVLLALTGLYGATGVFLCRQLTRRLRDWQSLAASLDELRKDRACLEKALA